MFTLAEILDIIIMVAALGYIFTGIIKKPTARHDLMSMYRPSFNLEDFKFACLIVAPAVVLHEFGHKFAALAFGLSATIHASIFGLGLGIALKLLNTGFIVFVPGFVSISNATPLQSALTAAAGPFVNFLLFLGPFLAIKHIKGLSMNTKYVLILTKKINLFLFIFNMIPIGFFDGAKVLSGLLRAFG